MGVITIALGIPSAWSNFVFCNQDFVVGQAMVIGATFSGYALLKLSLIHICVRYLLQNAYVLEADLFLRNKHLIRKYEYETNILGIPVDRTDDWCLMTDSSGVVTEETVGGLNCHQMVGISYWSSDDGVKLAYDLDEVSVSYTHLDVYKRQVLPHRHAVNR